MWTTPGRAAGSALAGPGRASTPAAVAAAAAPAHRNMAGRRDAGSTDTAPPRGRMLRTSAAPAEFLPRGGEKLLLRNAPGTPRRDESHDEQRQPHGSDAGGEPGRRRRR